MSETGGVTDRLVDVLRERLDGGCRLAPAT